jgi:carboxymethylenebutenolidase
MEPRNMTLVPITSEVFKLKTPDGEFSCYQAQPPRARVDAAVIVLQEIFGVNAFVRACCQWLAGNGFLAIAPDLYWRQSPNVELNESERDRAASLMKGLDHARAVADCTVLLNHIRSLPDMRSRKVAALGYCLGGKLACLVGANSNIDAVVSYYGVGIQSILDSVKTMRTPTLLHMGLDDTLCPPDAQQAIESALGSLEHIEIEMYPAGHAFARTGSPAYVPDSARRANERTLSFLSQRL